MSNEIHKKEGDALQSQGPRDPGVPSETDPTSSALPPAIAPPHNPLALAFRAWSNGDQSVGDYGRNVEVHEITGFEFQDEAELNDFRKDLCDFLGGYFAEKFYARTFYEEDVDLMREAQEAIEEPHEDDDALDLEWFDEFDAAVDRNCVRDQKGGEAGPKDGAQRTPDEPDGEAGTPKNQDR